MSLPTKFIVFLGRTFSGHNHDYLMLKQEFPPELDWFTDINVRVDCGMKRYNILVQVFRNRKAYFEDDAVGIYAGLWNFALSY